MTPNTVDFGNVDVGTQVDSSITVSNRGVTPVAVSQLNVSGQTFSVTSPGALPLTIAPGASYSVKVGFVPVGVTDYSGELSLMDATAQPITAIAMRGRGSAGSGFSLSRTNLSFGSVAVGGTATQMVTLTATGSSPVSVNAAAISGDGFKIVDGSLPVTLNPSEKVVLQVEFNPSVTGAAAGQLSISSNSKYSRNAVIALNGTGADDAHPQVSLSAGNLSFGSVAVATTATQTLTLTSTGSSPLTVNSAAISGAGFTLVGGSLPVTLDPSQTVVLRVQFKPTATGSVGGQLSISSNSTTSSTAVVRLGGTGITVTQPQLSLSAGSLSFGSVSVETVATQTLTLTSTGSSPVTVNSAAISGSAFTVAGASLPATLNPSQTLVLQVQFKPTAAGAVYRNLIISSDSTNGGTALVALSGTGAAAANSELTVSSGTLSFGDVPVATATTQSVTLTSTGSSPVTVNSAAISGAGFTLVGGSLPVTLDPSQSVVLQVQFKPTAAGAVAGQLSVSSNSTTGGTTSVALSGTGTAATIPQLSLSSGNLSFGSVTVATATTQSVTLTSTGSSPVTVNSAAISGAGFTLVGGSLPVTLNPSQSIVLQVQFKPTTAGAVAGQLSVSSNSTTGGTTTVALSGTGTAATNPQLTVSTSTLSFGSVTVATATTQSVTLTSTGSSPVTVNSAAISGAGFTLFGGSLPATLNPSQALVLQLQFKPTATGAVAGQLIVSSNSSTGGTALVALSGTGAAATNPQLAVSTNTLSFGNVTVETATAQSVTLTSTGTSPVTVNSIAISGTGFSLIGGSLPVTLNPSQTLVLQLQFKPTAAGAVSGQLVINSDSASGGSASVALSGTGASTSHFIALTWNAPASSTVPVQGYNIYRAISGGAFQVINAAVNAQTAYTDNNVTSGTSYDYVVKSVDYSGAESAASNQITLLVP